MITLITGTPGAGKTLRCVELLAELRNDDDPKTRSRLIFSNVNDLSPEIGAVSEFRPTALDGPARGQPDRRG